MKLGIEVGEQVKGVPYYAPVADTVCGKCVQAYFTL